MNNNLHKEKKNIVADPIYSELVGKTVNMSTLKGDYEDVLIHQYDQYTLIVEIDGNHFIGVARTPRPLGTGCVAEMPEANW